MPYLDHNATSTLRPEARAAMTRACEIHGNPSSVHRSGRAARALVEDAREQVAQLVNANPANVIFTSGGTEANALALWGAVHGSAESSAPIERFYASAIEHDSILGTMMAITDRTAGVCAAEIPAMTDGLVDLDALHDMLRKSGGRALVAVMAANNETGVIQPIAEVSKLVRKHGGLLLVDAVQACGKIATDFALDADYLTVSAHKLGGPQGVGVLAVKEGAPFAAQIHGGGQERSRRAGTENVAGIAGFGAAAKAVGDDDVSRLEMLRNVFESGLRNRFPAAIVFGQNSLRTANTSNFALPGIAAETALIALDLDGVMVSSGAACSSGRVKPSHVLRAMAVPDNLARSALRMSLGWNSSESDVDAALASLEKLSTRIFARKAA
ncbi:MAG TPA: cysteine desulfurase family protein [Rhizomicrobium sp.]|jgi:cysteine desulfurase|nr:cysteine desulfurase family protein [Rhizomicrobium sp.]